MYAPVRSTLLLAFAAIAVLVRPASASTTICVTSASGVGNATQFDNAMKYWQHASDETVYVHVEQGNYKLLASGDNYNIYGEFFYDQSGFAEHTGQLGNASLHLVGGFTPGTSCQKRVVDAANTTINGSSGGATSYLYLQQENAELLIDGLTFTGFGYGVDIESSSDSSVTVRNVILTGNGDGEATASALFVAVGSLFGGTSPVRIENCLIYGNNADGLQVSDDSGDDSVQILGCTIANNTGYGLRSYGPLDGSLIALNTIFYQNGLADIFAEAAGNRPTVEYSNYNSVSGVINHSNNQNTDPKFVDPVHGNYQLQAGSPFINIGIAQSYVYEGYAGTDIRGRTRVIGSHIDFGAYETSIDDTAPQVVDSLLDTTTGNTLRAAIKTANSNVNPTTIKFNVTNDGDCPHYIQLQSMLDDITSDITIDGYSQPGSAPNSVAPGYDGSICMVLDGGGLDHGLKTSGGGRLTIRGFEFETFGTAAIRLAAGSGNVVTGNGFSTLSDAGPMKDGVLIEGTASSSQIGSYAFGDRNVFSRATDAAIKLSSNGAGNHVIQGNYIGFNLDGTKRNDGQNKYGIYLQDSGSNEISFNFIGNSQLDAIELTGASTSANHIVENAIGLAPADDAAAGNGAGTCNPLCFGTFAAIDVASGAHGNYVGAVGGSGGNNLIVNNHGPGVQVESTAGTGNRVYGDNLIHDNGGYLAVDLGTLGPTVNDVSDTDFGGNDLQNYPTLSLAMRVSPGVMRISGSLLTQRIVTARKYRLDVYWTDTCLFSGGGADTPRGEMKRYVGFTDIDSDGTEFNLPFSNLDLAAASSLPTPGYLFAIATDKDGNTSEPGPCHAYVDDYIFKNAFQ